MTVRWLLAFLHLLALGIGLGSVYSRGKALSQVSVSGALKSVFTADSFWALSGVLWISTGLLRAFGGFEKGTEYYLGNTFFWIKMALLTGVILLEVIAILRIATWRLQLRDGDVDKVDVSAAAMLSRLSYVQVIMIVAMIGCATAMARGFGLQ